MVFLLDPADTPHSKPPFSPNQRYGKIVGVNPRARFPLLAGFTLAVLSLNAQDKKPAPADQQPQTGAITGRVLCADTRSPARLATVLTIPIPVFDTAGNATLPKVKGNDTARTNLEGDYTLPRIETGDYFVLAEMPGYLSPAAQFRMTDLKNLTPDSIKKLAQLLPSVHVEPGKKAHADVVIERGASISGKVIYDDGTPAVGVYVRIDLAHDVPPQEYRPIQGLAVNSAPMTDDYGHYRISGLPGAEYVIEASTGSVEPSGNPLADPDLDLSPDRVYVIMLDTTYAEKTLHKKNAKIFKLAPGEDVSDADIEIPLQGLYSISGTVAALGNQPPVFFGIVSLQDLDDKAFTREAIIHSDGSFQFPYLPPGKYKLKTASLSDQSPILRAGQERKADYPYGKANTTSKSLTQT
ncbi:carboxypeptidase-like regulatory domain-containing protein [Edaphobacter bradus]|uniref:carboxypeptidase-like regulatory domain-containing protein n=1 Tax=Edaphobacter bradus TaxID=2259016 RepID=UPI0021DF904C|nr:carboxypeptidase-like regulatory domain-containing protein [Edaphobacter bradus]